jgi:hypothetical protein
LHSSTVFFGGSKRWSRNDSDMVPLKSSIGEISSKISSRPDGEDRSVRPSASAAATRACQVSFPTSQSKLSTCNARRSGTSMGEEIFAKEMRRAVETSVKLSDWGLREATKGRPSTGSQKITSVLGAHAEPP